jgi:hypothetical protein
MCYKFLTSNETILRLFTRQIFVKLLLVIFQTRPGGFGNILKELRLGRSNKVVVYRDGF